MRDRILPMEAEKIARENKIQERLEAGELISYEEYALVLDDEASSRIEKRLEENGFVFFDEPGEGYRATMVITYEVNKTMLDGEWGYHQLNLQQFCYILQGIVGVKFSIVPISDSVNGAKNDPETWQLIEPFWNMAINQYIREENQ